MLKNYEDEETKRKFFMAQIRYSIMHTFEQLKMVEMELQILAHKASLTPEQIAENEKRSAQQD